MVCQGGLILAEVTLYKAAIGVGCGIGRVQLDGPVMVCQGGLILAEVTLRVAAIIVGSGQGRVQLDGLGVGIYCSF